VVVALAVTREGIPVRSWVFPGNTSDSTTIERVKADLRGWKLGRCLFVADAGMNSEGNRDELARACGKYLLAVRAGSIAEVKDDVLKRPGRYKELAKNLHVKEVVVGDGELRRRYLVCFNPEEEIRERWHRDEVLALIRDELAEHLDRSAKAKWAIELLASKQKGRYVSVNPENEVVIDPAKVRDAAKLDGKWVLITNDDTLAAEDAASGYKSLLVIERCFRTLKSASIHLGPVHHWRPNRIEAHVKICVLALLIQRVAELAASKPWSQVLTTLKKLQVTTFISKAHGFFRRNETTSDVQKTLQLLNVKPPALVVGVFALPLES
jgi:transposase